MKKLKATNRTEIAYKISGLWAPDAQITGQKGQWQKSGGKRPPESSGKGAGTPRSLVPGSRAVAPSGGSPGFYDIAKASGLSRKQVLAELAEAGKRVTKTTDPKSDNGYS